MEQIELLFDEPISRPWSSSTTAANPLSSAILSRIFSDVFFTICIRFGGRSAQQ
jgi:hypothetical protein